MPFLVVADNLKTQKEIRFGFYAKKKEKNFLSSIIYLSSCNKYFRLSDGKCK